MVYLGLKTETKEDEADARPKTRTLKLDRRRGELTNHLYRKLGVNNRHAAVTLAKAFGFLTTG